MLKSQSIRGAARLTVVEGAGTPPVLCLFPACVLCPTHTAGFTQGLGQPSGRFLSVLTHTFMCRCGVAWPQEGSDTRWRRTLLTCISGSQLCTSFFLKGCDFLFLGQRPLRQHQRCPKLMRAEATTTEQRTLAPMRSQRHHAPLRRGPCPMEAQPMGQPKAVGSHSQSLGPC